MSKSPMERQTREERPPYKFTIVIPCYNEKDAIGTTLAAIDRNLPKTNDYEIIVVNDGSIDGTH